MWLSLYKRGSPGFGLKQWACHFTALMVCLTVLEDMQGRGLSILPWVLDRALNVDWRRGIILAWEQSRGSNAELVVRLVKWHLRFQEYFIWVWEQDRPGSKTEAVQNPPENGGISERMKQRQQSVRATLIFCSHPRKSAMPPAEAQSYFKSATICSSKQKHFCDVTPNTTSMWFTCFVIWIWGEILKTYTAEETFISQTTELHII